VENLNEKHESCTKLTYTRQLQMQLTYWLEDSDYDTKVSQILSL